MQDSREQLTKAKTKIMITNIALYLAYGLIFVSFWGLFIFGFVALEEDIIFGISIFGYMVLVAVLGATAIDKLKHKVKVLEATISRLQSKIYIDNLHNETMEKEQGIN